MKKIYFIIYLILLSSFGFSQYAKLHDFTGIYAGATGEYPMGDLLFDGTFLYGMNYEGGAHSSGVIFKIKPDGSGFAKLYDFNTPAGMQPQGSLIFEGTYLYGTTFFGGTPGCGTIFKIKPDGSGYTTIYNFAGDASGSKPVSTLLSDGTYFYGMTCYGGTSDYGVVFKIKNDGSGYTKLLDFEGANGREPSASLISDGTYLYGMTQYGGSNDKGVIFKLKKDGSVSNVLLNFGGTTVGAYPNGSLFSDGTYLYGMTACNSKGGGAIFKIKPDGSGYSILLVFDPSQGYEARGSLISDGIFLYGMSWDGGSQNSGTIFKIKPDGSEFEKLYDFNANDIYGDHPLGSLILNGSELYGMASRGGTYDKGVIFKYALPGGINEHDMAKNFNIYPNPANSKITITNTLNLQKDVVISIFNIKGECVMSTATYNPNGINIDVNSLVNGIYMVKIQCEKVFVLKRLVIQ